MQKRKRGREKRRERGVKEKGKETKKLSGKGWRGRRYGDRERDGGGERY